MPNVGYDVLQSQPLNFAQEQLAARQMAYNKQQQAQQQIIQALATLGQYVQQQQEKKKEEEQQKLKNLADISSLVSRGEAPLSIFPQELQQSFLGRSIDTTGLGGSAENLAAMQNISPTAQISGTPGFMKRVKTEAPQTAQERMMESYRKQNIKSTKEKETFTKAKIEQVKGIRKAGGTFNAYGMFRPFRNEQEKDRYTETQLGPNWKELLENGNGSGTAETNNTDTIDMDTNW